MSISNRVDGSTGPARSPTLFRRIAAAVLGLGVIAGGTALVQAGDGVDVYETVRRFAAPRRVEAPVVQQQFAPLPRLFRSERAALPSSALGFAPTNTRSSVSTRSDTRYMPRDFPRGERMDLSAEHRAKPVRREARRKLQNQASSFHADRGLAQATNYCVRTCDGFAFPVGHADGNPVVQEHSCRAACPGAETQLFSAPAGAKDFDALSRGGYSYSMLPNAFRYRDQFDSSCRCHSPGHATNPSAVLTDLTLRRGDLVMSRLGMRHFEGSRRLPYRVNTFADAVLRLENPREVAIVRGMEVASMRGQLSPKAPDYIRERVARTMRLAEAEARRAAARRPQPTNLGRGFQELTQRETKGNAVLKTVARSKAFVALN